MNPNCISNLKQFYTSNNGPKKIIPSVFTKVVLQLTTSPLRTRDLASILKDGNKPHVKYNVAFSETNTCSFDCLFQMCDTTIILFSF
jgi:hypothetical protein